MSDETNNRKDIQFLEEKLREKDPEALEYINELKDTCLILGNFENFLILSQLLTLEASVITEDERKTEYDYLVHLYKESIRYLDELPRDFEPFQQEYQRIISYGSLRDLVLQDKDDFFDELTKPLFDKMYKSAKIMYENKLFLQEGNIMQERVQVLAQIFEEKYFEKNNEEEREELQDIRIDLNEKIVSFEKSPEKIYQLAELIYEKSRNIEEYEERGRLTNKALHYLNMALNYHPEQELLEEIHILRDKIEENY